MSDISNPLAWIERAEEDYLMTQSALRRKRPLTYSACFHAQQCAEKYLKAILVSKKIPFAKVHDLVLLNQQCMQAGVWIGIDVKQLNTLYDYAVRVRYPGDDPTEDDAREAFQIAKAVRRFSRKWLGAN
ncbi:MAG: HEPN domain-containing protein [Chloroflexi bacterium]|nr:HEPN domain-containing protein [Chloroflexota bacterium]MBU1660890.1 HEPN domain-containing protein [Chloroflexota bacterium]